MPGNFSCGVNIPEQMKGCFHPLQRCTGAEFDLASNHSFRDALQAKFMLSMDGHGAACVRVFDTLMSNSLLLKMEAPYLWMYRADCTFIQLSEHGSTLFQ